MNKIFFCLTLLMVIIMPLLGGCTQNNQDTTAIQAEGDMISKDFQVEDFTIINVDGFYNVAFQYSDEYLVTIEMSENLIDYVNVYVQRDTLEVKIDPGRDIGVEFGTTDSRPQITIYAPKITGVILSGSITTAEWDTIQSQSFFIEVSNFVDINFDLEVEELKINASGSSSIELSGIVEVADITLSEFSSILAFNMQMRNVQMKTSGSSSASIAVLESLDATVTDFSEIHYKGEPHVKRNVSGSASINSLE